MSKKDNYRIEGSGNTTGSADSALDKQYHEQIISKLKKAKITTEPVVARTIYHGHFNLKDNENPSTVSLVRFDTQSEKDWKDVLAKAGRHAANLKQYDQNYNVERFYELTADQKNALEAKEKRPPAGLTLESMTGGDSFFERAR